MVDMTVVDVHTRPHMAIACEDNTLRLFLLDAGGKFGQASHVFRDAYALAKRELGQNDTSRRGAALNDLADYGDTRSIELAYVLKSSGRKVVTAVPGSYWLTCTS